MSKSSGFRSFSTIPTRDTNISDTLGAYSGSLGAQYVYYCHDANWAGPIYGVYKEHGTPLCRNVDPCLCWCTITAVGEFVCLKGVIVVKYIPGLFFTYCLLIREYCAGHGKTLFHCKLLSGSIDYGFFLNIQMINKTSYCVIIAMYKMPCYKLCHCFKKVVCWYLPYYPHSAYSIVEAPTNSKTCKLEELPLISGGTIKYFYFLYGVSGYGPGKPVNCRCEFVVLEMCLTQMKANNNVCVTLARAVCNGNANECFYFNFRNTENGAITCGL